MLNDYDLIEKAINYIEANNITQPSLKEITNYLGLSENHFQKLFSRWANVKPEKFFQYIMPEHMKKSLKDSKNILNTTYHAGPYYSGRFYDLFVTFEILTQEALKKTDPDINIIYGIHDTPFGKIIIAAKDKNIIDLRFITTSEEDFIFKLKKNCIGASFEKDLSLTVQLVEKIFYTSRDKTLLNLIIRGTGFQVLVWQALLCIPEGHLVSYSDISELIGKPKAVRAVGTAISQNPIHYLIPCHRVLRQSGDIGGYAGGVVRKRAIIARECLLAY